MRARLLEDWQDEDLISRLPTPYEREVAIRAIKRRERRDAVVLGVVIGWGIGICFAAVMGLW